MKAFAVCIPEERVEYFGGFEPPEVGVPVGILVAATEGQAKFDALKAWTKRRMGVYSDDYPAIRVRSILTLKGAARRMEVTDSTDVLWNLWPRGWPQIERT